MHSFIRSIGFSQIKKDVDLFPLLQMTIDSPDMRSSYEKPDGEVFIEMKKEFGHRIGLAVCGSNIDDHQAFHIEYFYPYFRGQYDSVNEEIEIERHADKHSYAAICDDMRLGVTLIYYLQNISDFFKFTNGKMITKTGTSVLSALSTEGKIILPVEEVDTSRQNQKKKFMKRNNLLSAAKEGDEEAIENLTMEDIDQYSVLSRRVMSEDLLTIIDTSMMPYGIESDQYAVVGEIFDIHHSKNMITGENMILLSVNSKDILFEICINEKDLIGEPQIGRRFKGKIWMQGYMKF
ncbi:MAG: DUF3881 family protein [bacterium]|nr:DUF3881 family protein [bacterium]MDY4100028.1 DUF3881 family protein [Lachnospiraceae bacterium]